MKKSPYGRGKNPDQKDMKKKRLYEVDFIASYDFASLYPTTMSMPKIHKKLLRTSKINKIWKKIKE